MYRRCFEVVYYLPIREKGLNLPPYSGIIDLCDITEIFQTRSLPLFFGGKPREKTVSASCHRFHEPHKKIAEQFFYAARQPARFAGRLRRRGLTSPCIARHLHVRLA